MKVLERSGTFGNIHVLIEKAGEYEDFISQHAKTICNWHLKDLTHDRLMEHHRIKGSRDIPQNEFPYILTVETDDENEILVVNYVQLKEFVSDSEAPEHLYEFKIRRTYATSPYRVKESAFQIPAKDIFDAHLQLGQIHHRDDEYDLEVISWIQVR